MLQGLIIDLHHSQPAFGTILFNAFIWVSNASVQVYPSESRRPSIWVQLVIKLSPVNQQPVARQTVCGGYGQEYRNSQIDPIVVEWICVLAEPRYSGHIANLFIEP